MPDGPQRWHRSMYRWRASWQTATGLVQISGESWEWLARPESLSMEGLISLRGLERACTGAYKRGSYCAAPRKTLSFMRVRRWHTSDKRRKTPADDAYRFLVREAVGISAAFCCPGLSSSNHFMAIRLSYMKRLLRAAARVALLRQQFFRGDPDNSRSTRGRVRINVSRSMCGGCRRMQRGLTNRSLTLPGFLGIWGMCE